MILPTKHGKYSVHYIYMTLIINNIDESKNKLFSKYYLGNFLTNFKLSIQIALWPSPLLIKELVAQRDLYK